MTYCYHTTDKFKKIRNYWTVCNGQCWRWSHYVHCLEGSVKNGGSYFKNLNVVDKLGGKTWCPLYGGEHYMKVTVVQRWLFFRDVLPKARATYLIVQSMRIFPDSLVHDLYCCAYLSQNTTTGWFQHLGL